MLEAERHDPERVKHWVVLVDGAETQLDLVEAGAPRRQPLPARAAGLLLHGPGLDGRAAVINRTVTPAGCLGQESRRPSRGTGGRLNREFLASVWNSGYLCTDPSMRVA